MYLIDTDTLSNIVTKKPSELLVKKLREIPSRFQYTSAINIGEIYYGAYKSDKKDQIINAFEENVFPNLTKQGDCNIYKTGVKNVKTED